MVKDLLSVDAQKPAKQIIVNAKKQNNFAIPDVIKVANVVQIMNKNLSHYIITFFLL